VAQRVRHGSFRQIAASTRLNIRLRARLSCPPDWVLRAARLHVAPDCQTGRFTRLARLALVPDCQIGVFARLARLALVPDCQIGVFARLGVFSPTGAQAVRQNLCFSRPPDWIQCQIASRIICLPLGAFPRLIRLDFVFDRQTGSDWAPRQIARLDPPGWRQVEVSHPVNAENKSAKRGGCNRSG